MKKQTEESLYNPQTIEKKWPHSSAKRADSRGKVEDFNPLVIEKKWRRLWEEQGTNKTNLKGAKKPFFNLMMYPYPSAEGLHVGNVYAFTGADIYGRLKRMQGYDVFEPIGFDSGGIHSENYAIKVGVHPKIQIPKNVTHFTQQLHQIGCMYDWDHTVDAMDPSYYKWTQWIFVQLFKAGLAYKKKSAVTYCPSCKTTLSDEQTEERNGQRVCERCKTPVVKKELEQWFFRITKYAEKLLQNTYKLDWSEKVLLAQRSWIGKAQGINIEYPVVGTNEKVICFSTRPDTNFGATFVVLAPEHKLVEKLKGRIPKNLKGEIEEYIKKSKGKSEMDRIAEGREKTGIFTGLWCLNRLNNKKLPIWISDFVLGNVGTGAVVGVPGHDVRDFEFAKKFDLPIVRVVVGKDGDRSPITKIDQVQEEEGTMVNSEFLDGMDIHKATEKIMDYMVKEGWGKRQTIYKLRDWCISRQRYWGPPIPMVFCPRCVQEGKGYSSKRGEPYQGSIPNQMPGWYPVTEDQLPVLLPDTDDYLPGSVGGKSPLARVPEFVKTTCPKCGGPAQRETDVSDTFLDSSWYFLAYPNTGTQEYQGVTMNNSFSHPEFISGSTNKKMLKQVQHDEQKNAPRNNKTSPFNKEITKKWLPVSQYTGGAEHSVLHLLYSRFITMALHDLGYLDFEEPFPHFYAHGLIIKDSAKMSKSRGNIVNPDEYIAKFGADALRMYLMFLGPFNMGGDFRDTGMVGMYKFLARIWRFCQKKLKPYSSSVNEKSGSSLPAMRRDRTISETFSSKKEAFWVNKTIKKVGEDIGKFKYNTAIAAIMELVNFFSVQTQVSGKAIKLLILILAPFAPYMTEELWQDYKCHPELVSGSGKMLKQVFDRDDFDGELSRTAQTESVQHDKFSVHQQPWPTYDPEIIHEDSVTVIFQVNGKTRGKIKILHSTIEKLSNEKGKEYIINKMLKNEKVQRYLAGKKPIKTIFIPGKLVNFVV
jgi:leucyl-tRNA synthetase